MPSEGRRPRVAYVATHPIQYQAPWFAAIAARDDIDFEVLYCHTASPREQAAAGFGVEFDWDVPLFEGYVHRFIENRARRPSVSTFSGINCPSLGATLASGKYDFVVVSGWHYYAAWQAFTACWRLGIPVCVRSDSQLGARRSFHVRAVKSLLYPRFLRRMHRCLPVGTRSADYFRHFGVAESRIGVVPHCVDVETFAEGARRAAPRREEIRYRFGLAAGPVALFAGKLIEKKRPADLIAAIRLSSREVKLQALFVGSGPLQEFLESNALEDGLAERIRFAGFLNQSEIVEAYAVADVLVLPSISTETWGLVVNEAQACGLPTVVSNAVGCAPDLVERSGAGSVYPVGDVERLAVSLSELVSNRSLLEAARRHARAIAATVTPDRCAERFVELVRTPPPM